MQRLVLTVGTGKNGTHCVHAMVEAGAKGQPVTSFHEPLPVLDDVEAAIYEIGGFDGELAKKYHRWCSQVRLWLRGSDIVHIANNHLTLLLPIIRRDFPDVDLRVIHPIRRHVFATATRLMQHGAYTKEPHFPRFRSPGLKDEWESLSAYAKCVWLCRLKNQPVGAVIATEELSQQGETIKMLLGLSSFDIEAAEGAARTKPGQRTPGTVDVHVPSSAEAKEVRLVMGGHFDEW